MNEWCFLKLNRGGVRISILIKNIVRFTKPAPLFSFILNQREGSSGSSSKNMSTPSLLSWICGYSSTDLKRKISVIVQNDQLAIQ